MKCTETINSEICNGVMQPGQALAPIMGVITSDFIGDSKQPRRGQTLNPIGSKIKNVFKCTKCGHSFTS